MNKCISLVDKLSELHSLTIDEYQYLLDNRSPEVTDYLRERADKVRREYYGNKIFIRGLIEISNVCKNNCLDCGIRGGNENCGRYMLSENEILSCCDNGHKLGFRTFVLQGGEDNHFTDEIICDIVNKIKQQIPDEDRMKMEYEFQQFEKKINEELSKYGK